MHETNHKQIREEAMIELGNIIRFFSFTHSSCETRLVCLATVLFYFLLKSQLIIHHNAWTWHFLPLSVQRGLISKNQTQPWHPKYEDNVTLSLRFLKALKICSFFIAKWYHCLWKLNYMTFRQIKFRDIPWTGHQTGSPPINISDFPNKDTFTDKME